VPGVMNKKIIICKKSMKSMGAFFRDSPNEPGAKNGLVGLS
tara:strand:- start:231 stop:353 length:123 start_codon:yes stop_codon:yes gene_type:complete